MIFNKALVFATSMLFIASAAHAGAVSVPNTFTSGTAAVASEVNDNFTAMATGINANATDIASLEARVAALEATANGGALSVSDISGTYKVALLGLKLGESGDSFDTSTIDMTFDGAGSYTFIPSSSETLRVSRDAVTGQCSPSTSFLSTGGGTYTVSGHTITMTPDADPTFHLTAYAVGSGDMYVVQKADNAFDELLPYGGVDLMFGVKVTD